MTRSARIQTLAVGLSLALVSAMPAVSVTGDATWAQTVGGPIGGTVNRMRVINGRVWAALYSGGIYELDGSWRQVGIRPTNGLPENRASDLVPHPTDPLTVYTPMIIACGAKTTDGAQTWSGLCDVIVPTFGDNFTSQTLALDPADPQTVYIPGKNHLGVTMLLVSTDGGASFTKRHEFAQAYDFNHLVFFGERMFLGTRDNGVLVSDDRGTTWTALNAGTPGTTTARFVTFGGRLYLLGGRMQFNMRAGGGLYRLTAAGDAWETVAGPAKVTGGGASEDGSTLWVGGEDARMWRSTNGSTFTEVARTGLVRGQTVGEIVAQGATLYVGLGSSGVYRSTNAGGTFAEFNSGIRAIAAREVHVNPANAANIYAVTWDRPGMYWSSNSGGAYKRVGATYNILTVAPDPRAFSRVFAAGSQFLEGVFSSAGAVTWTKRVKPGPAASLVKSLAVHPTNSNIILAGIARETAESQPGYGVYYTRDRGKTWTRSTMTPNNKAVHSIVFNRSTPTIVWAAALGGGLFRSTNGGKSFARIGPSALRYPYRIAMDPRNPKHLVVGTNLFFANVPGGDWGLPANGGGLWETTNGGSSWRDLTVGLKNYPPPDDPEPFKVWKYNFGHQPNYEAILIDPRNASRIVVGHHGESVVSTVNGGASWQEQVSGMMPGEMHNYGYCLGQSASGSVMYGCTCGRGLFRGTVSTASARIAWQATEGGGHEPAEQATWLPQNEEQAAALIRSGAYDHRH